MSHIFYDIMQYPVPQMQAQFLWMQEEDTIIQPHHTDRSRTQEPNEIMSAYLDHIESYARLYRSIPFVEQIYLCNSITFNALHNDSDIDILIVTKPGMMWLARAWSWVMFSII